MRRLSLGIVVILAALSISTIIPARNAHATTTLVCIDSDTGNNIVDEVPLEWDTLVDCTSTNLDPFIQNTQYIVTKPNGDVVIDSRFGGHQDDRHISFHTNAVGIWHVQVIYFAVWNDIKGVKGEILDFAVSFFVIPESPIGAVVIVGSGLGALGAFMYFRKKQGSTISTDVIG